MIYRIIPSIRESTDLNFIAIFEQSKASPDFKYCQEHWLLILTFPNIYAAEGQHPKFILFFLSSLFSAEISRSLHCRRGWPRKWRLQGNFITGNNKLELELELYFYLNTVNLWDKIIIIIIIKKNTIYFNLCKHDLKI